MAKVLLPVLLAILMCDRIQADCEQSVIDSIGQLWASTAPTDVLGQLVGPSTNLYAASFMDDTDDIECLLTVLASDKTTATDFVYEADPENSWNDTYSMAEGKDGVITLVGDGPTDYVYTAFISNGVWGFYQCREDYDGFIGISVLNYDVSNAETAAAITEAEESLRKLGKEFLPKLKTNCPKN